MENYEWKQWIDYKRLHAIRLSQNDRYYYAACGVLSFLNRIFAEPETTQEKCKNCERELNGK